jgi:hypothetical protein
LDYFARTSTINIATQLRAGGEVVTPIWGVVVDGVPFIRSGYGAGSKWYRRVQRTRRATFVDGGQHYPGAVTNIDDEATNARVDAAYRAKYGTSSSVTQMVGPTARQFTMRVDLD